MRVLHTSDWHLGRTLHGRSRVPEHEAFLTELVEVARDVDVVLVSGDVFESSNPPIEAEELFYDALARLGDGGRRAVVVIAGNHDSPDRLAAPAPLTARHGVWILGRPADVPRERSGRGVRLAHGGPSTLTLDLPSGERAVIAALPYPSEARLKQLLSASIDEHDVQRAYNLRVAQVFDTLARSFEPGAVNLATSHLAVRSCMPRPSERVLVGGAWQVEGSVLPAGAHYVALGHLHLGQEVPDAPTVARYAGSPLAFKFAEREDPRHHVVVTARAGARDVQVDLLPISAGRPMVAWNAAGIAEVERLVAEGAGPTAWIDLTLALSARLTHAELARVKALPRDIVRVRTTLPEAVVRPLVDPQTRREMPIAELFRAFYREETGHEPETGLVELVNELAHGTDASSSAAASGSRAAS
jgi:exonuclease SbcD